MNWTSAPSARASSPPSRVSHREPTTIERELAAIERREADLRRAAGPTVEERPARSLRSRLTRRRAGH